MLSNITLKELSLEFIGDTMDSLYSYKTGPQLVQIFNDYFNAEDQYTQGFPSRWAYVSEKITQFEEKNDLQNFFSIILSNNFLRKHEDLKRTNVEQGINSRIEKFNAILDRDDLEIAKVNNGIIILNLEDIISEIGSGGFATVFISSNNRARKFLKSEFHSDDGVKHRFKREYEITESLQDINGIIPIFDYNSTELYYEMEYCDTNLEDYILKNDLNVEEKTNLVLNILEIISKVHQRNTIHRDLSPNNILMKNNNIYIADFGIGKDFNNHYSHQTMHTRSFGQLRYAAPEQLNDLSEATQRSDVYSLGKIINFIYNKTPDNTNHMLVSFSSKSTARNPEFRYEDASHLYKETKSYIDSQNKEGFKEKLFLKMQQNIIDDEVSGYVLSLSQKELSDMLAERSYMIGVYTSILVNNTIVSADFLQKLNSGIYTGYNWDAYDNFSAIAYNILIYNSGTFDYDSLIQAARLLNYVAQNVNRFDAQRKIDYLIDKGIDPTIEEILV